MTTIETNSTDKLKSSKLNWGDDGSLRSMGRHVRALSAVHVFAACLLVGCGGPNQVSVSLETLESIAGSHDPIASFRTDNPHFTLHLRHPSSIVVEVERVDVIDCNGAVVPTFLPLTEKPTKTLTVVFVDILAPLSGTACESTTEVGLVWHDRRKPAHTSKLKNTLKVAILR